MGHMFGLGMGQYGIGGFPAWSLTLMPLILLWTLFWKGLALWHAGRRREHWWFVALLLINTLGILEIVYLFGIAKLRLSDLFTAKGRD